MQNKSSTATGATNGLRDLITDDQSLNGAKGKFGHAVGRCMRTPNTPAHTPTLSYYENRHGGFDLKLADSTLLNPIASAKTEAVAASLVLCVNSHDKLRETLKDGLRELCNQIQEHCSMRSNPHPEDTNEAVLAMRAALKESEAK